MAYYLYDGSGYVGDLATNQGMDDLAAFIDQHGGEWLQHFIEEGWVPVSEDMLTEVLSLPDPEDADLKETWLNLKAMLHQCKDVAIISDGSE